MARLARMDATPDFDSRLPSETKTEIVGTSSRQIQREFFCDRSSFLSEIPVEMREVLEGVSSEMFGRRFQDLNPDQRAKVAEIWLDVTKGKAAVDSSAAQPADSPSGFINRLKRFFGFRTSS